MGEKDETDRFYKDRAFESAVIEVMLDSAICSGLVYMLFCPGSIFV